MGLNRPEILHTSLFFHGNSADFASSPLPLAISSPCEGNRRRSTLHLAVNRSSPTPQGRLLLPLKVYQSINAYQHASIT